MADLTLSDPRIRLSREWVENYFGTGGRRIAFGERDVPGETKSDSGRYPYENCYAERFRMISDRLQSDSAVILWLYYEGYCCSVIAACEGVSREAINKRFREWGIARPLGFIWMTPPVLIGNPAPSPECEEVGPRTLSRPKTPLAFFLQWKIGRRVGTPGNRRCKSKRS